MGLNLFISNSNIIMLKFFKKIMFITLISLVTTLVGVKVFGDFNQYLKTSFLKYPLGGGGHTYSRLSEVENIENIDILFLGSSHSYRGFDTRIFSNYGYSTFNLGTSSQTPIQSKFLLKKYIKQLNPKIIVFDLYHKTSSIKGVESAIDIISNSKNLSCFELKMFLEIGDVEVIKTFIYSFINKSLLKEKFQEETLKKYDKYVKGGFVEKSSVYSKCESGFPKIFENKLSKKQLSAIDDIINICKSNNVKIILVNTPLKKQYNLSYDHNIYFDSLMNSKAEYINFNTLNLSLNDTIHFYDKDHLSQKGVELFNKYFIEKVLGSIKP